MIPDTNFAGKLEPFLLMSKSMKGAAAAKLIQDATTAPGVFVFSELLYSPNIQELATNDQHSPYLDLLRLFAYKTYEDYLQHKHALPPLNDAQTLKLKYLSIVSLASERRILPYDQLLRALQMPTVRELEDLIIDAIYLDLLHGKLDQAQAQFEVESTMGRDVEQSQVSGLLAALQDWSSTTASVLSTLDAKIAHISSVSANHAQHRQAHDASVVQTLKEISEKYKTSSSSSSATPSALSGGSAKRNENSNPMGMDLDEPVEGGSTSKVRNRKVQEGASKQGARKRNRF